MGCLIHRTRGGFTFALFAALFAAAPARADVVYAWGSNSFGRLGDGTTTEQHAPEQIDPTDLHDIVAIAAANESGYALSSDGSVWSWGYNTYGELGLGNFTEYHTPQHLLPPSGYVFNSISADTRSDHALATVVATPEPASLSLLAAGALALFRRTRRKGIPSRVEM